jgi:L-ectoine synthase
MIVRTLTQLIGSERDIDWGNGRSRRFLLQSDGLGFALTDTMVRAGSESLLEYKNHLEACYCIEGKGSVIDLDGTEHVIEPGTMYALDQRDAHYLLASPDEDLRLVCVFTPPLKGDEAHDLDGDGSSAY